MPELHHRLRRSQGKSRGTVVFVHGVGSRGSAWSDVIDLMPGDLEIVTYDLRGHGESEKLPGPYSIDDFVDDHLQVLRELGIGRTHLVGASLGGLIVQRVAIREPQVVDRLVVMNSFAGLTPDERAARRARFQMLVDDDNAWSNVSNERWFSPQFLRDHPDLVEAHTRQLLANDRDCYVAAYEVLATNDFAEQLHRIQSETLAMTGEGDVGAPPHMSELMGRLIPRAQVAVLPGQKHLPWLEQPQVVADHLVSFLLGEEPGSNAPPADPATRSSEDPARARQ